MSSSRIAIAVGGTGGHILPAKQLAALLKKNKTILFMGMGIKSSPLLQEMDIPLYDIPSAGVRKKGFWDLCKAFFAIGKGVIKSIALLRKHKIQKVVGFGSFHAFPVLFAARLLRIPLYLFEANCTLGKVNRFFAKKAFLALQFPINASVPFSFTYVRPLPWIKPLSLEKNEARRNLGLKEELFTILVFGGSQGASFLNQLIKDALLEKKLPQIQIIHLTGNETVSKEVKEFYRSLNISSFVSAFENRMNLLYSASDLVIGRSGAGTISELAHYVKPAFLVPYPHAADNHQEENARFFTDVIKGGRFSPQKEVSPLFFTIHIKEMMKKDKLLEYEQNILLYKEKEEKKEKKDFTNYL